jgi:hypothetical protein
MFGGSDCITMQIDMIAMCKIVYRNCIVLLQLFHYNIPFLFSRQQKRKEAEEKRSDYKSDRRS